MATAVKIIKPYGPKIGVRVYFPEDETGAKQSFKDECDINNIMAKYRKTGALTHVNEHSSRYGFATSQDFREAMEIVTTAKEMFEDLPAHLRQKFGHSPEAFLEFVQDPDNSEALYEMGLAERAVEVQTQEPAPEEAPKVSEESLAEETKL
jgi:phage internal scaffolding protein